MAVNGPLLEPTSELTLKEVIVRIEAKEFKTYKSISLIVIIIPIAFGPAADQRIAVSDICKRHA